MRHGTNKVGKTMLLLLAGATTPLLASSAGAATPRLEVRLPSGAQGRVVTRSRSQPTTAVPLKLRGFDALAPAHHLPIEAIAAQMFGVSNGAIVPTSSNGSIGPLQGVHPRTVANVKRCGGAACSFEFQQEGDARFRGQLEPAKDGSALLLMRQRLE